MRNLFLLILIAITPIILKGQDNPHAYLGITSNQVNKSKADKLNFNVPYGVYLTRVIPSTTADLIGLEPFDYIYRIGDYDLNDNMSLGDVMKLLKPGDKVNLYYIRNGEKLEKSAVLGSSKDNVGYDRSGDEDPLLGVHESHDRNNNITGVIVNVSANSTAEDIGMLDGDIVTQIDNYPIIDWHDLGAAVNHRKAGDNITVTIWRNDKKLTFSGPIRPENSAHNSNWSWDNDWDWTQTWDVKYESTEIDIVDMKAQLIDMNSEELEKAIKDTGLEMPRINNLKIEAVEVFPNPNVGMFTLNFELPESGITLIRAYSGNGQLVLNRNLGEYQGSFSENLDIAGAGPGIFYLMIQQEDFSITRKIIVTN